MTTATTTRNKTETQQPTRMARLRLVELALVHERRMMEIGSRNLTMAKQIGRREQHCNNNNQQHRKPTTNPQVMFGVAGQRWQQQWQGRRRMST